MHLRWRKISAQLSLYATCYSHEYCEIRAQTNYPYTSAETILHKKLLDILIIRYKININFIYQFNKSQQHSF